MMESTSTKKIYLQRSEPVKETEENSGEDDLSDEEDLLKENDELNLEDKMLSIISNTLETKLDKIIEIITLHYNTTNQIEISSKNLINFVSSNSRSSSISTKKLSTPVLESTFRNPLTSINPTLSNYSLYLPILLHQVFHSLKSLLCLVILYFRIM